MVLWGQKDRILRGFVPKRSFLCWWMRKKHPKKIVLDPAKVKKGGQNRGTHVSPIT